MVQLSLNRLIKIISNRERLSFLVYVAVGLPVTWRVMVFNPTVPELRGGNPLRHGQSC